MNKDIKQFDLDEYFDIEKFCLQCEELKKRMTAENTKIISNDYLNQEQKKIQLQSASNFYLQEVEYAIEEAKRYKTITL